MAKKASEIFKVYNNENGPVISNVGRNVIEKDGLYFKDIDGSGELSQVNDWRNSPEDRARAYVKKLTVPEKLGQLFIADWRMGIHQKDESLRDATGILDEGEIKKGQNIFARQDLPSTTGAIKDWFARHFIIRANVKPEELTDWHNQLHALAEECEHFVPVQTASNSRNEHGEVVFGMNDAAGIFATWPGTLGIAAAVKGDSLDIIDGFASCVRREWNATGLRKGYMYMADVVSDPRWQRTYGTFGEDPQLISDIFERMIPIIQGSEEGPTADGVAMTVKHFPGGGARENGFDPHYAMGQWNVYATEGSLDKYHLPAFRVAVKKNASSFMPYYAKPALLKSKAQQAEGGNVEMAPYGFAFNKYFIDELLRNQMGFKGYINSDSGILHAMAWGVEKLDVPERIAFAVANAGVDVISGSFDPDDAKEAYARAHNDYYDTHELPDGFTKEQVTLSDEALDRAVANTLTEMFRLGMFENTYRDPELAKQIVAEPSDWKIAEEVHRKSVVLMKNDAVLPLTADKLEGKKIYAEAFNKTPEKAVAATAELKELLSAYTLTEKPEEADFAVLMLSPSSGEYFNATPGFLELDICEDKLVPNVDIEGKPSAETHLETTLSGAGRIADIAKAVRDNGGKVIINVNFTLAWLMGNVEPYADVLTAGFDTFPEAALDVFFGKFRPTGKLPLTLPKDDSVIAVDKNGVCISPNDVPGFDKDKYMPEHMKDENGKAYAYRDSMGNYYEYGFGLTY